MHENHKRRLLLVSNKVYHYRVPVYEHLSRRLEKIGYDLVVLTNEIDSHASKPERFKMIVQPFGVSGYWKTIVQHEPSIVMFFLHARDFIVWPLLCFLKVRGTKVIYWNHGINLQTPDSRLKRVVFGLFHRFSDAIVLYSENEKKYISREYWPKTFVANNTINFDFVPDIPEPKTTIREQLSVRFDKVVLFVGRITKEKRLQDLVAAAKFLDSGIGVVIVGNGLDQELEKRLSNTANIQYLGGIYDPEAVNRVFKMADVFSIPGKVGLGVNQAFYWGLPIVTEDVHHSPEIIYVRDGVNGFIVEQGNVRMLADRINFLLASEERYRRFSEAARAEILEQASIDRMCDGFLDAIGVLDRQYRNATESGTH